MRDFGRDTVVAAVSTLGELGHSDIERFILEHRLEGTPAERGMSRADKANSIIRYLVTNPDLPAPDGRYLSDVIVRHLVGLAIERSGQVNPWKPNPFDDTFPNLSRALLRDGYAVSAGQLIRGVPDEVGLPEQHSELELMLNHYGLTVALGHLQQAISAHSQGQWAAANGQMRSFLESLFDGIAERLASSTDPLPAPGHPRRQWLAKRQPPFLREELNEWNDQGHGFIQSLIRRFHPQGPHPGLSDPDDSTLRLHLSLIVGRAMLRRLYGLLGR
jgi:hypothetical protein